MRGRKQLTEPGLYVAAVLSCWTVLILLSLVGHPYLVADVPYSVPYFGMAIASWVHQWVVPFLFALLYWKATRHITSRQTLVVLGAMFVSVLGMVWLVTLARHDRVLSLIQGAFLFWGVWAALSSLGLGWTVRAGLDTCFAVLFGGVYYSAIWGETRCDEKTEVACLKAVGPRVWVPKMLAGIGVPVFADLRGIDLQTANLSGRDLRYADLRGADLKFVDLGGSNLRRALIDGAVAGNSNWRDAYLDGASFIGADLNGAALGGVHAYRVDFRGADLANTDIRNASLSHALIAKVRLNGALLNGTYMRFVEGLVDSQLAEACGDRDTLLPPGFSIQTCSRAVRR